MSGNSKVYLSEWSIYLEENEDRNQVVMRIRGLWNNGIWFSSAPVKEAYLGKYEWEVHTEKEVYNLVKEISCERKRGERGWWGSFREKWSVLADRLPEKLKFFAWFWEAPPENEWDFFQDISAALNSEEIREWKSKYKIRENPQLLYPVDANSGSIESNDV